MMHGTGQSDSCIVPGKPLNEAGQPVEERVEGRRLAKGNARQSTMRRTPSRTDGMQEALARIQGAVRRDGKERMTALYHHVYRLEHLREAYLGLRRDAAVGVDGETWEAYGRDLERNLEGLSERLGRGAYHPPPVRRVYIPKADGRQRPLGVPSLEDKIVQAVVAGVLTSIWEEEFLGFSYGFRPGRSPHGALDALTVGLERRPVRWVLDADIRAFFDTLSHEWLLRFLEHRMGDKRVVRLVRRWLKAGVLEDGQWTASAEGTPQGGLISPILANIYLHYVFDLWVQHWRRRAQGAVIVVRYADDFVVGFERREEAETFQQELGARLEQFQLELHPEKTRLIEFGRQAAVERERRGEGKPETFDFLGFTHICGKTRKGAFTVLRQTAAQRMRRKLQALKLEMKRRLHETVPVQGAWLRRVVLGHYQYYGVPCNGPRLSAFRHGVHRLWWRALARRSQRTKNLRERMARRAKEWLPYPRIVHPYPSQRLRVIT